MWHDGLMLGFAPMDSVHEELLNLLATLRHAPDVGMSAALERMAVHSRDHFNAEEAWMAETGFPGQSCHAAEHDAVMRPIEGVKGRVALGEFSVARRLEMELFAWFPADANYLDSALAHWVIRQRHGGNPMVLRRALAPQSPAIHV